MYSYRGASEEHGDVRHNKCIRMTPPCIPVRRMGGEWGKIRKQYTENACSEEDMALDAHLSNNAWMPMRLGHNSGEGGVRSHRDASGV